MGATFSSVVKGRWTGAAQDGEVSQAAAPDGGGEKRTSWPELVGYGVIDAAFEIIKDRPEVRVFFYNHGKDAPPCGFDPKRVVIFCDSNNIVVTVPTYG